MGVKDFIQKQAENYFEKKELAAQRQKEYDEQTHVMINFTSGTQQIKCAPNCLMHQRPDGIIHFGFNTVNSYVLVSYEWNGPQYNTITNSNTQGTEIKKGKAGKIGVGAIAGSLIAPGIGTAVGAAMGAGSKGKKNTQSNTTSISKKMEIPTPATIKIKNIETSEIFGLTFNCTSQLDSKIKALRFESEIPAKTEPEILIEDNGQPEATVSPSATDLYEELKKLKELLDMDIITQEEFDIKKKQLLAL